MAFWNRKKQNGEDRVVQASSLEERLLNALQKRNILFEGQRPEEDDYGYSPQNPICTSTIEASCAYLSRLRGPMGERIFWQRVGSLSLKECHRVKDVSVDKYEIFLCGESFRILYLCPYAHNSEFTPKEFSLAEEGDNYNGDLKKAASDMGITIPLFLKIKQLEAKTNKKGLSSDNPSNCSNSI